MKYEIACFMDLETGATYQLRKRVSGRKDENSTRTRWKETLWGRKEDYTINGSCGRGDIYRRKEVEMPSSLILDEKKCR